MKATTFIAAVLGLGIAAAPALAEHGDPLAEVIAGDHRSEASKARDEFRNPYETLKFFGLQPDMTVVELWPGGGWYGEIISPFVKDRGSYIAAHFNPDTEHSFGDYFRRSLTGFNARVEAEPDVFGGAQVVKFEPGVLNELPADGSVDMALTFRNAHNWLRDDAFGDALAAVYAALKPGGVFGVIDHRANPDAEIDPQARNGYVNEAEMVRMVEAAGFRLIGESAINNNPRDTADHPGGVWTLPPNLRVPEGEDSEKYKAIGESDRMTLKFIKPGN